MYFYLINLASLVVLLIIPSSDSQLLNSMYIVGLTFENCDTFFSLLEYAYSDKKYWFKPDNFIKYFRKKLFNILISVLPIHT